MVRQDTSNRSELESATFLKQKDKEEQFREYWKKYIDRFTRSVAGNIVASYILDVSNRHSCNIMIQQNTGYMFHIDFEHILGDKTKFAGFNMEVEPFIYLKEMHNAIRYDPTRNKVRKLYNVNYLKLETYVGRGINIARENSPVFENLLVLMLPANIEGLNKVTIKKAMENLSLELSDHIVNIEIKRKINQAFRSSRRGLDNWCRLNCNWIKSCLLMCVCKTTKTLEPKKFKEPKYKIRRYRMFEGTT